MISNEHRVVPAVIFLPRWILKVAERNRITVGNLLKEPENYNKYLSFEDKVLLSATQYYAHQAITEIRQSDREECYYSCHGDETFRQILEANSPADFNTIHELSMSTEYQTRLKARLQEAHPSNILNGEIATEPSVVEIDEDTIALVLPTGQLLNYGNLKQDNIDLHIRAMEVLLKRLYVYSPVKLVNTTLWYQRYLDCLWYKHQLRLGTS